MEKVLVFSNSQNVHQQIESSFAKYGYDFQISRGAFEYCDFIRHLVTSGEETFQATKVNIVLLDAGIFVQKDASSWLDYFYDIIEDLEKELNIDLMLHDVPVMLMDSQRDFIYIQNVLKAGFVDYMFTKPFDAALVIQKLKLYFSEQNKKESLVEEMDIQENAFLSLQFEVVKISVYGAVLKAFQPVKLSAVVELNLSFIAELETNSEDEQSSSRLICRCFKTEKHPEDPKAYLVHLQFLAINDLERKNIRTWMNEEYARIKTNSLAESEK